MDDWQKGLIAPKLNLEKLEALGYGSSPFALPADAALGTAYNVTTSAPVISSDAAGSKGALRIRLPQTGGEKCKRALDGSSPSKRSSAAPQYLPSGKDFSKRGPHRLDTELYAIGLPRGLASATKDDSCALVDMFQTPEDQKCFDTHDTVTLRKACAQKLVHLNSLFSRVMDDINKDSEPALKEELQQKDSALTAAKLKISELENTIKTMERERPALEKRSFEAGLASGVQLCRRKLFSSLSMKA